MQGFVNRIEELEFYSKNNRKYSTIAEHIFFSSTCGIFFRLYHMLGHKTCLNSFKKTKIIQSNFSNNSGIKLEINNARKTGKFTNMQKLNNILLNNQWVKEEITKEIRKYFERNENKKQRIKTYGIQQKQCLEGNLQQQMSTFKKI